MHTGYTSWSSRTYLITLGWGLTRGGTLKHYSALSAILELSIQYECFNLRSPHLYLVCFWSSLARHVARSTFWQYESIRSTKVYGSFNDVDIDIMNTGWALLKTMKSYRDGKICENSIATQFQMWGTAQLLLEGNVDDRPFVLCMAWLQDVMFKWHISRAKLR